MNKLQATTRIWQGTLDKIRVAASLAGQSQVVFMDEMVNYWLSLNGYDPKQIEDGDSVQSWSDIKRGGGR